MGDSKFLGHKKGACHSCYGGRQSVWQGYRGPLDFYYDPLLWESIIIPAWEENRS